MTITNIRLGFATNSSSSHSIVLHKTADRLPDNDPYDGFGWSNFVLNSPQAKLEYLLTDHRDVETKILLLKRAQELGINGIQEASYIDHDSSGTSRAPSGIDFNLWLDFVLSDQVSIYGGNDNDDSSFPFGYGVHGIKLGWGLEWKQDGNALIGFNRQTGDKFRWSSTPYTKSTTPELVDLKITDYCAYGCEFCYQGSTTAGQHAPLDTLKAIIDELARLKVFELAIGGGEPSMHPNFTEILEHAIKRGITPNFTAYGNDWTQKLPKNYRGGIGISVHKSADLKKILSARSSIPSHTYPDLMAQTVVGTLPAADLMQLFENCWEERIPLLLLGYKHVGRGTTFQPHPLSKGEMSMLLMHIKQRIESHDDWYDPIHLSVDTAFVDAYSDVLDEIGVPFILRSSPEGAFSMYIDAVTDRVGPSSYYPDQMTPRTKAIYSHFQDF